MAEQWWQNDTDCSALIVLPIFVCWQQTGRMDCPKIIIVQHRGGRSHCSNGLRRRGGPEPARNIEITCAPDQKPAGFNEIDPAVEVGAGKGQSGTS